MRFLNDLQDGEGTRETNKTQEKIADVALLVQSALSLFTAAAINVDVYLGESRG